jgi:N-terminal domain of reverse transcriptase
MTIATTAVGAASHITDDWHATDWQKVNRNVRRLQARIVKAEQEGKPGKAGALQRLLTHSFSGKALAVRRVTENQCFCQAKREPFDPRKGSHADSVVCCSINVARFAECAVIELQARSQVPLAAHTAKPQCM